ncbi:MAG: beta-ketoacyl-ACP synthase III [Candidatus Oxydemutatoraceae bacterium WSBS_2016_MAG_OTU14]
MQYAKVIGTGSYLPKKILTNKDLEKRLDTSDQWIQERTGICERHIAADDEYSSDLAIHASRQAIEMADIDPQTIEMVIVATTTADKIFPSTASLVQNKLGIAPCPAFDLQAACTGFVYGLATANSFIQSGTAKRILVVGSEVMSRILDWDDRSTCVLFGDGAGAFVLEANDEPGICSTHIYGDGRYADLLHVSKQTNETVQMKGNEVFKMAVKTLGKIAEDAISDCETNMAGKIDWLVPHQANARIIAATAKKLGFSLSQVVQTVSMHGNTSSASVPLAFDVAVRDGRIQRGQTVLLEAFGAGFTWGSVLLKF